MFRISPLVIEIALWYHCRPIDYVTSEGRKIHCWPPAVEEAVQELLHRGMLVRNEGLTYHCYRATSILHEYVSALVAVPLPNTKETSSAPANDL